MSLSIADTFGIGIVTTGLAFAAALFMREIPLRRSNTESVPSPAAEGAAAGEGGPQPRFRESPVTE